MEIGELQEMKLTASVIIPVFNKENYLDDCFASLLGQTIDHSEMEALFVDDGSTDGSLGMLREFASVHPWAKVISKANGGVSSARNAGIDEAAGKYLFFLDPDDTFAPETLEAVSSFFDTCYHDVDLVTYPIVAIKGGQEQSLHYRYSIMDHSGVYDLNEGENVFISQTTMNICVKNMRENNVRFDFVPSSGVVIHEDEKYCTDILLRQMRIGYCSDAIYCWRKNADGVTTKHSLPLYLYEASMELFEDYFSRFDCVPRYVQALLVNDVSWKMKSHVFLPWYLRQAAYDQALERLGSLLRRVDPNLIARHPNLNVDSRVFLSWLRSGKTLRSCLGGGSIAQFDGDALVYASNAAKLVLLRASVRDEMLELVGCLEAPFFLGFDGAVELQALCSRGANRGSCCYEDVPLEASSRSYGGDKAVVKQVYSFRFSCRLASSDRVRFRLLLNGEEIGLKWSLSGRVDMAKALRSTLYFDVWQVSIVPEKGYLDIRKLSSKGLRKALRETNKRIARLGTRVERSLVGVLSTCLKKAGKRLWLYTDAPGKVDNSWTQFEYDAASRDGVLRFYAANALGKGVKRNPLRGVVKFGSRLHKALYCCADILVCSDISFTCYSPMTKKALRDYADIVHPRFVYTQHGVLWAHMPWYYAYDNVLFDNIVVSTNFEIDNLISNYQYHAADMIPSGMPRYDFLDLKVLPQKKILLCPSWRSYLVGNLTREGREPRVEALLRSDFWRGIQSFLLSPDLQTLLSSSGYRLDVKLHPIFRQYEAFLDLVGDRVSFVSDGFREEEYDIVITDYSSYSFDYVYLGRKIIYYLPDASLFFGGVNHYSELDIPLEEAFGPVCYSSEELLREVSDAVRGPWDVGEVYSARASNFFLHYDGGNRKRLHDALEEMS